MKLFEVAPVAVSQPKIWHMTERANLGNIEQEGIMYPNSQMRGAGYQDNRLHFFTSTSPEALEEIEQVVRFGGVDFDNNDLMNQRAEIPLVILELNMQELAEFDEQMDIDRKWFKDIGVTEDVGIWTPNIVPFTDTMKVVKTL